MCNKIVNQKKKKNSYLIRNFIKSLTKKNLKKIQRMLKKKKFAFFFKQLLANKMVIMTVRL